MADSLILSGVKDVKKHVGSEMSLALTKRGITEHSLREWWTGGKSAVYAKCTVFNVKVGNNICKLAIPVSDDSYIRIDHDGKFNFQFYGARNVKRVALYDRDFTLIEHYVMPSVSSGKVMTVTPANGAKKPTLAVELPKVTEAPEPPKKRKSTSRLKIELGQ